MISFLMAGDMGTLLGPTRTCVQRSNRPSGAPYIKVMEVINLKNIDKPARLTNIDHYNKDKHFHFT